MRFSRTARGANWAGEVRDETGARTALTSRPSSAAAGASRAGERADAAGLVKGIDFNSRCQSRRGRAPAPDAVINLPEGRKLVVDRNARSSFLDACERSTTRKGQCFKAHLGSIVRHAQQLGSKTYWAQFGDAAEFVIMYIPGEHFLSAALEMDAELWEKAFRNKVLLATPTNLVAIARTVASVWRQEKLAAAADEIANLGKELHSRLAPWLRIVAHGQ